MTQPVSPFVQLLAADKSNSQYDSLLKEAMKNIIDISSGLWTDHNEHDPGITILEALCYSLTEQLHLTGLPIADQLQLLRGTKAQNDFFDPKDVLFNTPVTLLDWRKWLIDQDTILNAWITTQKESTPSIFLQNNSYNFTSGIQLVLKGIYEVLIQWAPDKLLGELNGNILSVNQTVNLLIGATATYWADIIFPFTWDTTDPDFIGFKGNMTLNTITIVSSGLEPDPTSQGVYFADLKINYTDPVTLMTRDIIVSIILRVNTPMLTTEEQDAVVLAYKSYLTSLNGPVFQYNKIIKQCNLLASQTMQALMKQRNLAEDFAALNAVNIVEIGVQCDLEITPGIDVVPLLAEIFFVLDLFISPVILQDELPDNEQWKAFEGPILKNGYLSDYKLQLPPGRSIFLSDVLHVMLEGIQHQRNTNIIALFNLSIQSFINNKLAGESEENCLRLPDDFTWRPRLNIFKSNIVIRQRGVIKSYDPGAVYNAYQTLKNTVVTTTPVSVLPVLVPTDELTYNNSYYPIQYEMPACYELRLKELTSTNAQARGYFFFFEQLLANFQTQWQSGMQLLSINNADTETRNPANLRKLLPFYDSYLSPLYENALKTDKDDNYARRGELLDHLLARIGEDFRYYSIWDNLTPIAANTAKYNFLHAAPGLSYKRFQAFNYTQPSWNTTNTATILQKLVHLFQLPDKLVKRRWKNWNPLFAFSGVYPKIHFTASQGVNPMMKSIDYAFDYEAQDGTSDFLIWGINKDNYQITTSAGVYSFVLMDDKSHILATSVNTYPTPAAATNAATSFAAYLKANWLPTEGLHLLELILLRPQTYATPMLQDKFLSIPLMPDLTIAEGFGTDMYSSQLLVVLPGAGPRFGDDAYQEVATAVIKKELPAWLQIRVVWLNIVLMYEFENAFEAWTNAISNPAISEANFKLAKSDMIDSVNNIFNWLKNRGEY
ncbi:hypothetical protein DVR12_24185 [Chitinophaga silvatica]|uniref:Uncharacterized protein n=1 Tax=Chitinophaga silvatica TaxID=2282649 RepID=A0A3E1Y3U4_9BACT|nr:hypothetical protein [Chitinophaga silvatica]RFS19333.1 hypothetical protein DVR12_24185 [Chitinophaga silvatica]